MLLFNFFILRKSMAVKVDITQSNVWVLSIRHVSIRLSADNKIIYCDCVVYSPHFDFFSVQNNLRNKNKLASSSPRCIARFRNQFLVV